MTDEYTGKKIVSPLDFKTDPAIAATLTQKMNCAANAHEAEAWANALKSFMIALGIQKNLERLSS